MKITIITVCFNNASTLEQSILSVLNQNYNSIEYILIDGASTDGTLDIIQKYKSKINKVISEPDTGIYDALNKGVKNATGDIIGFLHADDVFYDNYVIEKIAKGFEDNNCDAIYGNLQYVAKENTNKIIRNWQSKPFNKTLLAKGWMPAHPTLYLKKEIYSKYGTFNTKYRIAADYDFMLRILSQNIKTHYLSEYFVKMRVGGKSNSLKNLINKMKEDLDVLKKNEVGGIYSLFLKNISKLPQFFK